MFISKKKPSEICILRNDKLCDLCKFGEWNLGDEDGLGL